MACDHCGEEFGSEREELEHVLDEHGDDITSHREDDIKRKLNRMDEDSSTGFSYRKPAKAAAVILLVAGAGYGLLSTGMLQFSASQEPTGNAAGTEIPLENEPVLGSEAANITVVVYEDLECPACSSFDASVMEELKSGYVESGEVKVVWKDFPLGLLGDMHPWSYDAARAAECVYREDNDAFWAVKDRVFSNQDSITVDNVIDTVKGYAEEEGVSADAVQQCLDNDSPGDEVKADVQEGRSLGVEGTPSVFVNGRMVQTNYVIQAVEQELSE